MSFYIRCSYQHHGLKKYLSLPKQLIQFLFLFQVTERRKFFKWILLEPVPAAVSFLEVKCFESSYENISNYRDNAHRMLFIVFSHDEDLTLVQKVKSIPTSSITIIPLYLEKYVHHDYIIASSISFKKSLVCLLCMSLY